MRIHKYQSLSHPGISDSILPHFCSNHSCNTSSAIQIAETFYECETSSVMLSKLDPPINRFKCNKSPGWDSDPGPPDTNSTVYDFIYSTILTGDMAKGRNLTVELSYPLGMLGYRSAVKTGIRNSGLHGPDLTLQQTWTSLCIAGSKRLAGFNDKPDKSKRENSISGDYMQRNAILQARYDHP
jgi:hypothetical protein